jgi:hypothetical protein
MIDIIAIQDEIRTPILCGFAGRVRETGPNGPATHGGFIGGILGDEADLKGSFEDGLL